MKKILFVFFFGLTILNVSAQIINRNAENNLFESDSTTFNSEVKIKLNGKTKFTDYKIISHSRDTTIVDTTLTLQKNYKLNYLRKDNFELLPFHNQGQTFTKLGYNFKNSSLFPAIGVRSKQFNYYKIEDIYYYEVPTPTSEIMYRTGLEQGQVLDAFLTMNTSRQFNFSIAYKGLRSLGKYRNSLASHGNFRTSFNYHSKAKNYYIRGHFSSFDLLNNENGGLTQQSIINFENNDPNFIDRARLDVNFVDAESIFEGKRYYIDQTISIFSKKEAIKKREAALKKSLKTSDSIAKVLSLLPLKDSLVAKTDSLLTKNSPKIKSNIIATKKTKKVDTVSNSISATNKDSIQIEKRLLFDLKLGHTLTYETQHYRFKQDKVNPVFGDAYDTTISDHTSYQKMNNQVSLEINAPYIGKLRAKANYFNYNYHYNSILFFNTQSTITDKLKGNAVALGADWKTKFGDIYLNADASTFVLGDLTGNSIKASVLYKNDSIFSFKGFAEITSKTPDFNKLLYQSDYKDYNWQNNFGNENIKNIGFEFKSTKWGTINASFNVIDNYIYFNENSTPVQATKTLNYLKVKINKDFTYKNFTLNNTIMYQSVSKGSSFFRVPELVTRNTLYYSNYLFKGKPLYMQTGVTFKYFTAFKANAYNPLLNEFVLQNTVEIGNYPIFDFFVNAQIRRTRIFIKVENFSSNFTGRNYYSAPNHPYRDFTVRFGLVWNWFI